MKITSSTEKKVDIFSKSTLNYKISRFWRRMRLPLGHRHLPAMLLLGTMLSLAGMGSKAFAKPSQDSLCASYKRAIDLNSKQEIDSCFVLAQAVAQAWLQQGDTLGALTAMYLQAIPSSMPERALAIIDSALALHEKAFRDTTDIYIRFLTLKARKLLDMQRFKEGLELQDQLDHLVEALPAKDPIWTETIFNYWVQRGYWGEDQGLPEIAIPMFEYALTYSDDSTKQISQRSVAGCHSRLSQDYRKVQNIPQAIHHAQLAIQIVQAIAPRDARMEASLFQYLSDYAVVLEDAGKLDSAAMILQQCIANEKQANPQRRAIDRAKLGHVYMQQNRLDEAWDLIFQCRTFIAQNSPQEKRYIARLDQNLATILYLKRKFEEAIRFANRLKAESEATGLSGGDFQAQLCKLNAESHLGLAQYDSAMIYAVDMLHNTFDQDSTSIDGMNIDFSKVYAPAEHLGALELLGKIAEKQFQLHGQIQDLHQANAYYTRASRFMAHLDGKRMDFSANYYRWERLWIENYGILEGAIRCKILLNRQLHQPQYLRDAMLISDLGKARQIYKSHLFFGDLIKDLVPAHVRRAERMLLERIAFYRRLSRIAQDSQANREALQHISEWEGHQRRLLVIIQKYYPRYYLLKYQNQANFELTKAAVTAPIARYDAVLEYFEGHDTIYAFLKTTEGIEAAIIPHKTEIEALIQRFAEKIESGKLLREILPLGNRLSAQLLPFKRPQHPITNLLIIPDGSLYDLPFEAIAFGNYAAQNQGPKYLIEFTNVMEDFSLTAHATARHTLAIMPPAETAYDFQPRLRVRYQDCKTGEYKDAFVPGTFAGMEELQELLELKKFEYAAATREAFWEAMKTPAIVQLTTHGFENCNSLSEPYFILSKENDAPDSLFLSALFGIPNFRNRTFILNACVTAQGRYLPGEGPISFARSFRQVGCPTVISNRWYASERANAALLRTYYARIALGDHPAQALGIAKRVAIHSDRDAERRHPKYWTGLGGYGAW